jgi:LPS sulfotransferase NodH
MPRRRGNQVLPSLGQVLDSARKGFDSPWHLFEIKHLSDQNLGLYPMLSRLDWMQYLIANGYCHHLVMRRRNGLRRIVSHLRAAQTGQYVVNSVRHSQPQMKVEVSLDSIVHGFASRSLLEWLEIYELGHQQMMSVVKDCSLNDSSISFLELTYEDHIQKDPIQAYRMVCEFLSVPCESVDVRYAAINAGLLINLISNFDDVCDYLSTTRFSWMLEL